MTSDHVRKWLATHVLHPIHVDCATTVMLKILDGKCKMPDNEKRVMEWLYDQVRLRPGQVLAPSLHALIESARATRDDHMKMLVYEQRLLAETTLSRPVMKSFKAMIRQEGLLDGAENDEQNG